jgi:hypothetical protein
MASALRLAALCAVLVHGSSGWGDMPCASSPSPSSSSPPTATSWGCDVSPVRQGRVRASERPAICCEPWADAAGASSPLRLRVGGGGEDDDDEETARPQGWPALVGGSLPPGCRYCAAAAHVDARHVDRSFLLPSGKVKLFGHLAVLENAAGHVSVVTPRGACGDDDNEEDNDDDKDDDDGADGEDDGDAVSQDPASAPLDAEEDATRRESGGREEDGTAQPLPPRRRVRVGRLAPADETARGASFLQHYVASSLLPPPGYDSDDDVEIVSRVDGCRIATNAGLFAPATGACLGTTVTGGRVRSLSGRRNAHFGLLSTAAVAPAVGSKVKGVKGGAGAGEEKKVVPPRGAALRHAFVSGYLGGGEVESLMAAAEEQGFHRASEGGDAGGDGGSAASPPPPPPPPSPIVPPGSRAAVTELVGGAVWLVRGGRPVATESGLHVEDSRVQETGAGRMGPFVRAESGRTAVGHDAAGRLVLAQIDGRSWWTGLDLPSFAVWLASMGAVSAVNLDGGGSATWVTDGVVANTPTYGCSGASSAAVGLNGTGKGTTAGAAASAAAAASSAPTAGSDTYNADARPERNFGCPRPVSSVLCIHDAPPMPILVKGTAEEGGARARLLLTSGCACVAPGGGLTLSDLVGMVEFAGGEEGEEGEGEGEGGARSLRGGERCLCTREGGAGASSGVREHYVLRRLSAASAATPSPLPRPSVTPSPITSPSPSPKAASGPAGGKKATSSPLPAPTTKDAGVAGATRKPAPTKTKDAAAGEEEGEGETTEALFENADIAGALAKKRAGGGGEKGGGGAR